MGHYVWLHNLSHGNPLLSRIGLQPPSHIFDTCLAAIQQRKCSSAAVRLDMMGGSLRVRHQLPDRLSESAVFGAGCCGKYRCWRRHNRCNSTGIFLLSDPPSPVQTDAATRNRGGADWGRFI
ncbi:hypothetical protein ETB97_009781 [Aspergillus alliaceus]|uniref:Uncharacterized protein n=1 Tax=Petromyces alliaceus TaxID=209559 RepID=A0A8H6E8L6_PETAA|nr:hypothetical protein ETB97_009781 [Aspergillus burnettii]